MPFSDYVPGINEDSLSVYYRNVLGVPVRKRMIIIVLTLLALFVIIVTAILYGKYGETSDANVKSFSLPYVSLESSIDESFNPCENFYDFVCSQWPKNKLVSDLEPEKVSTFDLLQKHIDQKKQDIFENSKKSNDLPHVVNNAIEFHVLCLNGDKDKELSVNYLLEYFDKAFGGWPVLDPDNWNENNFDWIKASAFLLQTLALETITGLYSLIDDYNTSQRLIYLRPINWKSKPNLDDEFSLDLLRSAITCLNRTNIQETEMFDSIIKIQETNMIWVEIFNYNQLESNLTKMTLGQLQKNVTDFDWFNYIQLVSNYSLNEIDEFLTEDDVIIIEHYEHLKTSITYFMAENISKADIANLFGWFVVQKVFFLIPGVFKEHVKYEAPSEIESLAKTKCYSLVKELYQCSLDYLYIHHSPLTGIADGKVLVHYIKHALYDLINNTKWLDISTKQAALQKLNSMYSVIGYQDYLGDAKKLDSFYQEYPNITSSLLESYFKVKFLSVSLSLQDVKLQRFTRYTSPRTVTDVSAYYAPQQNIFTLPISMYNLPFYHFHGPWYLNFGSLGSIIGHEIMHGFDKEGCKRDSSGTIRNWWTNESSNAYHFQTNCFKHQYMRYESAKVQNNELITLNEDIADSEGLRIAFMAYEHWAKDNGKERSLVIGKKKYSPEQAFFISFGSIWCSNDQSSDPDILQDSVHNYRRLRIIGSVSNSKGFADAFKCPRESAMNPDVKCKLW